jgi:hypothetical protein
MWARESEGGGGGSRCTPNMLPRIKDPKWSDPSPDQA